jgi:hypothetical protein
MQGRNAAFFLRECRYCAATLIDRAALMQHPVFLLCLLLALAGCEQGIPAAPVLPDSLQSELITKRGPTPPSTGDGQCWADDVIPAIIETVTQQVLVRPEKRDANGMVIKAAVFQTEAAQRIVQDRRAVWFRTPCPEMQTLDYIASLQRALKARGYYRGALTGQLDGPSRLALRQFQEALGLDSERLSLAAAQRLGISATEFKR